MMINEIDMIGVENWWSRIEVGHHAVISVVLTVWSSVFFEKF